MMRAFHVSVGERSSWLFVLAAMSGQEVASLRMSPSTFRSSRWSALRELWAKNLAGAVIFSRGSIS